MHHRLLTYLCFAINALFAMSLTIMSPLIPAMATAFNLTLAETGFIFSANFIGFVAFILIGGILADRWGKKQVLAVALAGFVVSLLLMSLAPSFLIVCLVAVFIGGFGGILESQIGALVVALNPDRSTYYLNLAQVFFGVGALIGPTVAGIMLSSGVDWRQCFLILGVLSLGVLVIFAPLRAPRIAESDGMNWKAIGSLVRDQRFMLICLCMLLYTGAEVGAWGWMTTFLSRGLGFSIIAASTAVGVFWVSMTIGRFLCGFLTLRFPLRSIIIGLAGASAVVTLLSVVISNEIAVWVIIVALGLAYSSQWPLIAAYGSERYTVSSGTVFALLVGSGGLGTVIVPYSMGVIGQYTSLRFAMVLPALLFLAIVAVMWRIEQPLANRSLETSS